MKKDWLGQQYLIKILNKKFGEKVKNMQMYKTPETAMFEIMIPI